MRPFSKLLIPLLLFSATSFGQIIINNTGSPNILTREPNRQVWSVFIVPVYSDTTAPLTKGVDSLGMVIQIRSTGAWYKRDTSAGTHKWTLFGSGGGGGSDSAVNVVPSGGLVKSVVSGIIYLAVDSSKYTTVYAHRKSIDSLGTLLAGKASTSLAPGNILIGNGSSVATAFSVTGDIGFSSSGVATTTANAITNAKAAQMAAGTIKGNVTGGTANAADLTGTQTTTLLDVFTSSLKGLVPSSGGGTSNFLRADGTWSAVPGGFVDPLTTNGDIIARISGSTTRFPIGAHAGMVLKTGPTNTLLWGDTTAGGGGSQTFPQVLATGRTFSADDSVLMATKNLYVKNGTLKIDSALEGRTYIGGVAGQIGILWSDIFKDRTAIGSNYTTATPNATIAFTATEMAISGGNNTYNNYIQRNYYMAGEQWITQVRGKINTINSTSFGIELGVKGTNFNIYALFAMDNGGTNLGKIFLQTVAGTTFQTSGSALTIAAGDSILMTVTRNHEILTATYANLTSATSVSTSYSFPYGAGANYYPNTALPTLFILGGSQNINEWTTVGTAPKNIPVAFVGHSITQGYGAGTIGARYENVLFSSDYSKFSVNAGPSDNMTDVINRMPEIVSYSPSYFVLDIGTNDISPGALTTAQFYTKYASIVRKLLDAGSKVICLSVTPRNTIDVTPFNTVIQAICRLYGVTYVNTFTGLASGTNLNATYDYGDGLHINGAGHALIASTIASAVPALLTAGTDYNLTAANKRSTINNPVQFADSASFNSVLYVNTDGNLTDSSAKVWNVRTLKQYLATATNSAYIGNQTTLQSSANMNIDGAAKAGTLISNGSYTAAAGIADPNLWTPTLTAAANNDVLIGFHSKPTFVPGAFTPVAKISGRFENGYLNIPSDDVIIGATGDVGTARLGITGGSLRAIDISGATGFAVNVTGTINGSGTAAVGVNIVSTLTAQANNTTLTGLIINTPFSDNGKTGVVHQGLNVVTGNTNFANGLQLDVVNTNEPRMTATAATTMNYQNGNTTVQHRFKSFVAGADDLVVEGSAVAGGNLFKVNDTAARIAFQVKGRGNTMVGNQAADSNYKLQVIGTSWFTDSMHLKNVKDGLNTDSIAVLKQLSPGRFLLSKISPSALASGLADPGSNGILKRTALNVTAVASAGDFPTLNQNTTGSAAALSAASALPSGTTATTQAAGDNSAKVATTAYMDATIARGAYVPTMTGTNNIASVTSDTAIWTKNGNVVDVDGFVTLSATAGVSTSTQFVIQLPIASPLVGQHACWGMANTLGSGVGGSAATNGIITGDITSHSAQVTYISSGTSSLTLTYHFRYIIQ